MLNVDTCITSQTRHLETNLLQTLRYHNVYYTYTLLTFNIARDAFCAYKISVENSITKIEISRHYAKTDLHFGKNLHLFIGLASLFSFVVPNKFCLQIIISTDSLTVKSCVSWLCILRSFANCYTNGGIFNNLSVKRIYWMIFIDILAFCKYYCPKKSS